MTDRPFRPGNGARTVVKLKVRRTSGTGWDRFEFDAFGAAGDIAAKLYTGDIVSVAGRVEDREFTENGETVHELRIVANFIEIMARSNERI